MAIKSLLFTLLFTLHLYSGSGIKGQKAPKSSISMDSSLGARGVIHMDFLRYVSFPNTIKEMRK